MLPNGSGVPRFNEAAAHHRGERRCDSLMMPSRARFNEAAAHHRGEQAMARARAQGKSAASMRPRLSRSASFRRFNEAAAHHRGELKAAEILLAPGTQASMRPRLITAENFREARLSRSAVQQASMRPRLITAENVAVGDRHLPIHRASMRPRLITAENPPARSRGPTDDRRFNEAAAHHRGERRYGRRATRVSTSCFNEAAAHHRGEHPRVPIDVGVRAASMRPRLITAENVRQRADRPPCGCWCFNEAAAHHRGERGRRRRGDS